MKDNVWVVTYETEPDFPLEGGKCLELWSTNEGVNARYVELAKIDNIYNIKVVLRGLNH